MVNKTQLYLVITFSPFEQPTNTRMPKYETWKIDNTTTRNHDNLKQVGTPFNILLHDHFKKYLSLYAPIYSDEYHAWLVAVSGKVERS